MSWKSIEMQVALPRTQDAGKLQEQMSKQNQHFQESLAGLQLKEHEQRRKQVQHFDQVTNLTIKDDENKETYKEEKDKERNQQDENEISHPYLGLHFDSKG
ncbi:hypothetical protein [Ornithinibacillus halophilus]|uniref:Uncharacterized protein n=1 Tax=Ornithinibacillus halophilus TaxID=930117 RepID=A0A1M5CC75_9BACI|nr:hypothetical protein [Ornithinibacillus halophilus]SHF52197.1 hypothetical protein SAMN05216225_1001168 [Ornithinibacillus halophilus]